MLLISIFLCLAESFRQILIIYFFQLDANQADEDQEEEEDDENIEEIYNNSSKIDENQLYHNPLMRGYLKMNCLLERQVQNEEDGTQLEINIKLQICELFDKLLDIRQDFLIENTIHWFYQNITNILQTEDKSQIDQIMLSGISKILPNIPKTGIQEIDEQFNKQKEENAFMRVLQNENQSFYKFENFSQNSWLSISFVKNDEDEFQNPSYAILPYLIQSFILIHNPQLEKKCLSLLMRVFNQRQELVQNLNKLEIIFDKQKSILYKFMTNNILELSKLIEQSEDWFEEFVKNDSTFENFEPIRKVMEIIKNLKNSFFHQIIFDEEKQKFNHNSEIKIFDQNKQKIFNYLKAYEPILDLIKDGKYLIDLIIFLLSD